MLTKRGLLRLGAAAVSTTAAHRAFAAQPTRTGLGFEVPRGACDCHVHIQDPAKFPYVANRVYTPPPASVDELLELQRALHLERVVVVQPSVYGTDNACTLDAVRRLGGRARAVVVIGEQTARGELDEMNRAGARGVRLNLETTTAGAFDADRAKALLDRVAEQINGLNWHVQFYTRPSVIAGLKDHLAQLPFPVVFDHFARATAQQGPEQPGFNAVYELVKSGRAYIKISGAYRVSERAPDYPDVMPLAQALVSANPDRIIWGTDWPHPNSDFGRGKPLTEIAPPFAIDDGLLLNQLAKWVPEATTRKKILVDNPARLYGFG